MLLILLYSIILILLVVFSLCMKGTFMKVKIIAVKLILPILTLLNTLFYWSIKPIWFHINKTLGSFFGVYQFWAQFIWVLLLLTCLYLVLIIIKGKKLVVHSIIIGTLNLVFTALNIYLYIQIGSDTSMILGSIIPILPMLIIISLVLLSIIAFPMLKPFKKLYVRLIAVVIAITVILLLFLNIGTFTITSDPLIQYADNDTVAVTWTTNKKSTGWVEYGPNNNELTTVNSSNHGLIDGYTTYHKILIDIPETGKFIFRVGNQEVKNYYQCNVEYGKHIYSDFIRYKDNRKNTDTSFYILSDVHERTDIYEKYLSGNDYDFVVLNGDIICSADTEKIIVNKFLSPFSHAIDNSKPYYFVRGNHETRGALSREIPNYVSLPNDRYFYTFTNGCIFAIVLDTGEDKLDDHEEYSGLADFAHYKKEQTQWLDKVKQSESYKNAKYKIAFTHIPLNTYHNDDRYPSFSETESDWVKLLNSIGIDILFSGHTHDSQVIEPVSTYHNFPIIIGGGYKEAKSGYEALKVIVMNDLLSVEFVDEDGNILDQYEID